MARPRLWHNRLAAAGLTIVGLLIVVAAAAPLIARHDPSAIDLLHPLDPPSGQHWLGTDSLGRDVWSRWIYGARISLEVGVIAVGIALLIGTLIGAMAGYYGGWIDSVLMRCVDVMLCIPTFFLLLAVIAFLQPGIGTIMVVIGITGWMGIARLVRAEVLTLKEREFIQAARGLGASDARIILRHLLPNAIAPILVAGTLGIGGAILTESALSFLGLGVQPPTPSWGNMLIEAKATLGVAWWLTVYPGLAILITVLGFNLLGEGLREQWGRR